MLCEITVTLCSNSTQHMLLHVVLILPVGGPAIITKHAYLK
jgi:hypothetical protein